MTTSFQFTVHRSQVTFVASAVIKQGEMINEATRGSA